MEAMMGMPIICNDVRGNTEIAYNGENAIVVNEWDELLETLNRLPQMNKETYLSMCQKSREIYGQNFTFERFKRSYLELLNSL
jgi:glycosyltransferase involved in cell wall biosynthesis